ncbi:hypothetical protein DPM19_13425 [Actinomadura craniellae]|uniref:DUF2029 domain-containing protein n=1 Tax=Actinomadura craniellae TaxID=2231787 RepID=A0A365H6J7_9ACTN|nr:glycosyltransferase 87 family protein [Actinomadura craniellae]RAY14740.1 hypothetical protein DPM19_13425 [Actinomadura craniellae]
MSQQSPEAKVLEEPGPRRTASPWSAGLVASLSGATLLVGLLGFLQKLPCQNARFDFVRTVTHGCYTDIYPLYYGRELNQGKIPYFDRLADPMGYVEYPVLSGWFMQGVAWLIRPFGADDGGLAFYLVTVLILALLAVPAVLATVYTAGRHGRRAGLMVALSPGLLLAAYINWDLLAVALTALALAAWSRRRPALAGALLGLAIAAKFYPVVLLGPFLLLCVRAGQWRALGRLLGGTAATWLLINLPVMLFAWTGWGRFYEFSKERGVDWGSVFFYLMNHGMPSVADVDRLNLIGQGSFALLCLLIAVLALAAPRRPRLPQLLFLVLAAFMLTNKVWSPQYVLWLLPLAVLARPKLPAFLVWQAGEVIYFFGIWWYLLSVTQQVDGADLGTTLSALRSFDVPDDGISVDVYHLALFARFLTVLLLVTLVVVDILRPAGDLVRADGTDDPAGGVLDEAPDRWSLGRLRARRPRPAAVTG